MAEEIGTFPLRGKAQGCGLGGGGLELRSELSAGSGLHLLRGNPGCLSCYRGWLAVGQGWMREEEEGP